MTTDDPRRPAVRKALEQQFGRAITVTDAMIAAVLAELDTGTGSEGEGR